MWTSAPKTGSHWNDFQSFLSASPLTFLWEAGRKSRKWWSCDCMVLQLHVQTFAKHPDHNPVTAGLLWQNFENWSKVPFIQCHQNFEWLLNECCYPRTIRTKFWIRNNKFKLQNGTFSFKVRDFFAREVWSVTILHWVCSNRVCPNSLESLNLDFCTEQCLDSLAQTGPFNCMTWLHICLKC